MVSLYNNCYIVSMAHQLASRRIANEELAPHLGLEPDDIVSKTGIRTRYHCDPEKENLYVLMATATEKAARRAGIDLSEIQGIFTACNHTGDFLMPGPSTIVASLLGIDTFYNGFGGIGCCGGLFALQDACNQLEIDGYAHNVVGFFDTLEGAKNKTRSIYAIIVGDQTSRILKENSTDEMLFSDGAACFFVANDDKYEPLYRVISANRTTTYRNSGALIVRNNEEKKLEHDGRSVFRFALNALETAKDLTGEEISPKTYIVPHQANLRILNRFDHPNIYKDGVADIGNTSPASVFIGLEDATRKDYINPEQDVLLLVFGEGLSVATAELKYSVKKLPESGSDEGIVRKYMQRFNDLWGIKK